MQLVSLHAVKLTSYQADTLAGGNGEGLGGGRKGGQELQNSICVNAWTPISVEKILRFELSSRYAGLSNNGLQGTNFNFSVIRDRETVIVPFAKQYGSPSFEFL